jgi:hypothetical protein
LPILIGISHRKLVLQPSGSSDNLATETVKGLSQKAARGGTVSRAPIGYRNVGVRDEHGREVRTVEVDPDRAPLVSWAFKVYASGEWTVNQLHRELVARGLTTLGTPRRPSRPIGLSSVHRMLTNPYYKGNVRYRGVIYDGSPDCVEGVRLLKKSLSARSAVQKRSGTRLKHYKNGDFSPCFRG